MQVSTADLSAILGLTDRHLQRLETQGVLRKTQYGEWDLAETVQAYVAHRIKAQPRHSAARGKTEERLKAAKAQREELKLQRERMEVIPTELALQIIGDAIGMLRAGLAGVPARITRDMTLRGKIETDIDRVLTGCADDFAKRSAALAAPEHVDAAAAEADAGSVGGDEP